MRGIVIDHVRGRQASKRGGGLHVTTLDTAAAESISDADELAGAALEDVLFLRDEMANMAWSIERCTESPLEQVAPRYEAADAAAARWTDGSTWLWTGPQERVGRGEGSSGLRFDEIEEPRTTPATT